MGRVQNPIRSLNAWGLIVGVVTVLTFVSLYRPSSRTDASQATEQSWASNPPSQIQRGHRVVFGGSRIASQRGVSSDEQTGADAQPPAAPSGSLTSESTSPNPTASEVLPDMSAHAEKIVRRFNAEIDRWVRERPVMVVDIQSFSEGLKSVPKSRRMECLRRALNLIPDVNAGLLAGIVLDKSQDKEIVETTFRDIVNRSEEVKEPILKEIAKDKTHPCYSDVEWIYEVTGEKPTE